MITTTKRIRTASIPVVLYLRMSSDKQDCSIDDQRAELLAYAAKHGYTIVREYVDEGISGWKSQQRAGFKHLIADATGGDFKIVLCWDQSRFSRFAPMEANYYWHQLAQAGVSIETIKEGKLDFDSLGGWLSASVQQHAKAEYVKSLAADCARGQRQRRKDCKWAGPAPLGYIIAADGKLALGNPDQVALVRRIFAMRESGMGYRGIAYRLTTEGIKPRRSGQWRFNTIAELLRNQAFIGNTIYGHRARGRFARVLEGVQVVEGTHEPIIDRKQWDRVQAMLGAPRQRHSTGLNEGSALSGLLYCGDCGAVMYDVKSADHYVCSGYHSHGTCSHNRVKRPEMLAIIAERIRQDVLLGGVEKLTAALERAIGRQQASTPKIDLGAVRKAIADIDRKLSAAAERLMEVDGSLVKAIETKMLDLQSQRETLQAKMEAVPTPRKAPSAKALAERLWKLDETLRSGSAATIRHALSHLIGRIEIEFEPKPNTLRASRIPTGGFIHQKSPTSSRRVDA